MSETPPPIAAGFPPTNVATTTNPTPSAVSNANAFIVAPPLTAPYRLLPPLIRVFLHPIVDAHEPREPADKRPDDREQRSRMHPLIEKPATGPEQENGDREIERHSEVLVALTVSFGLRLVVFLSGSHCCAR